MKNRLALFIFVFYFGSAVAGLAQDFSYTYPQEPGMELNYMSSDYPYYYHPIILQYIGPIRLFQQSMRYRLPRNVSGQTSI